MALTVRVDIDPATKARVNKLNPRAVEEAIASGVRMFQVLALRRLPRRTQALTKTRTGTLARSWRTEIAGPNEIRFTNIALSSGKDRTPYATFIEFGTRAHFVKPKDPNGVLVWNLMGRPLSAFSVSAIKSNRKNFGFSAGHQVKGVKARKIFFGFWRANAQRLSQFIGEELGRLLPSR